MELGFHLVMHDKSKNLGSVSCVFVLLHDESKNLGSVLYVFVQHGLSLGLGGSAPACEVYESKNLGSVSYTFSL